MSDQWAARLRARVDLPVPPLGVMRVMTPNMRGLSAFMNLEISDIHELLNTRLLVWNCKGFSIYKFMIS